MKDSRVWRILSWMSTPCDMQSFIVWMIVGTAEREMARREMRRWSELSAIVNTLTFFRLPAHEYKAKEVFRVCAILPSKKNVSRCAE